MSRGLGDVYKRQVSIPTTPPSLTPVTVATPVRVKNCRSLDTPTTLANVSVVKASL